MFSASGSGSSSLIAEREHDKYYLCQEANGKEVLEWQMGGSIMCNALCALLKEPQTNVYTYYVDEEKVSTLKKEAVANQSDPNLFVSTNDLLSAHFADVTDLSTCLIAMNFRKRVSCLGENLAGNYEGALLFDRESCTDPVLIRKTLQAGPPFRHASGAPVPGCCNTCCSQKLGLITNWASFFSGDLAIPGSEQVMHMPICDPSQCPWPIAVVFRPCKGKTAIMYFLQRQDSTDLLGGNSPLGAPFNACQ